MDRLYVASDRIRRLRRRYHEELPIISMERARYYTESWRATENSDISLGIRVAMAMRNVYENMGIHVDPDDRIVGTWTENFLGVPLDIEKGIFNDVLRIELDKSTMILHQVKTQLQFVKFLISKYGLFNIYKSNKQIKKIGADMPGIGTRTMSERSVNPYGISPEDKKLLYKELLPYWKGKTLADTFHSELMGSDVYKGDFGDFVAALPRDTANYWTFLNPGCTTCTWQGHLILDHKRPIEIGLLKMKEEVAGRLSDGGDLSGEERDALKSFDIALDGVITYAKRLEEKVRYEYERARDPERKAVLSRILETCARVPLYPATSFAEAVQSFWTVKTAVELAVPLNAHGPGRLDQLFYPYYAKDIESGALTREEAKELLEELFLKIITHNIRPFSGYTSPYVQRYEGSMPVTMGGLNEEGEDATNELSYLMLEAAASSKTTINFFVRVHKNSPDRLLKTVAELHSMGVSSVAVINDEISTQALRNHGFSQEDANAYCLTGCVDMISPGKTGHEGFSALTMCRILDLTLRNGDAQTLIGKLHDVGVKTGDPDTFTSFDQLLDAFIEQVGFQIKIIMDAAWLRDKCFAEHFPAPHISAFIQGCVDSGKDVTHGGGIYTLEGILVLNSIANVVDSLYVIKKLIFEQKKFTFAQLIDAIDNNYEGYEWLHELVKGVDGKWGNSNPESDRIAREMTTRIFEQMYEYRTYNGGVCAPYINSMTSHTYDGRIAAATPDGRKAGTPYAPSCGPYNVDKFGPTGVLRSVTAIDFSHVMGCAVNVKVHPSAIGETEYTRDKWASLIKTYFELGGEQLQPTVVSNETLRAAQKDPDSYRDVIVKVGGYSAYFVELGNEIQDEIISRSEHASL